MRDPDRRHRRHPPRPRGRPGALGGGVRRPARPRRPRAARRRPDDARRARSRRRWSPPRCAGLDVPIVAVLGNHDWHSGRHEEVTAILQEGGIDVLERDHRVLEICGAEVGIAGTQGVRRRLRRRAHPRLRRAADAARLRGVDGGGGRARRRRCARSRCARSASRCSTTRRSPRRWRASGATSGRSSAPTGSRRRCASTIRTSSCTATRTRARSRDAWASAGLQRLRAGAGRGLLGVRDDRRAPAAVRGPLTPRE